MPDDGLGHVGEAPAVNLGAKVEVDVLVESEVALVVAAELGEQLAAQEAGGAADAEDLPGLTRLRSLRLPRAELEGPAVGAQRLAAAVEAGALGASGPGRVLELEQARLHAAEPGVGGERRQQDADAAGLEHGVGVEDEDRLRRGAGDAEVDRRRETGVAGQRQAGHAALSQVLDRAVAGAIVDHQQLQLGALVAQRVEAGWQQLAGIPAGDHNRHRSGPLHAAEA